MKAVRISTDRWDEGAPLGSGKTGSLIYGGNPLKITVDRTDLWDLRANETTQEAAFNFATLERLVKSGGEEDWKEYTRLFDDVFTDKPYPSKITAGRIELFFDGVKESVAVVLDMQNATAEVFCGEEKIADVFVDYNTHVGAIKAYRGTKIAFHVPEYLSATEEENGLEYPRAQEKREGNFTWFEQKTRTDYAFGIVVYQKGSEAYYTLATTDDREDYIECAKEALISAADQGFETLQKAHKTSWAAYWEKSALTIPDKAMQSVYEKSWYLFRCCSRSGYYPMPLQGVWTADNDALPPWKGDYHHDTNTQLSYQSYLKANRLEEGVAFVEYLWKLKPTFERFAREFFGVDGLLLPSCSSLDGKAMGGWAQYALSPTMTIWAAQSFDEYYLYTGDEEFLKTRAFPYFEEIGRAIKGLLREKEGKLYLPLSSSPEIYDNTSEAYLEPNSNFDLALLIYLYKTLKGYCEILGKSAEEYDEILSKLDEIAVDERKGVLLDKTRALPVSHRHFSHLACMYPLHLLDYDTLGHKKIYECTIGEIERLGTGNWAGFSFAMAAQIYAMAKHGNAAYEKLRQFCTGFVGENGFHLNGDFKHYGYTQLHYRPFTLESSFGFCDALHEILLQDHRGEIELFPAVPNEWKNGVIEFKNLRSRGGLLVSAKQKDGEVVKATVFAEKECEVRVFGKVFRLKKGKNVLL